MMRFFAFDYEAEMRLGVELNDVRHDITRGTVRDFGKRTLLEILASDQLNDLISSIEEKTLLLEDMPAAFTWLAPIPRPGKIVAMVQNYRKHAAEFGNEAPPNPVWFGKIASSLTGHETAIKIPSWVDGRVDHEVELGAVIGKYCKEVAEDKALECVAGYTVVNDMSARRIQKEDREKKHPWLRCKNFDTFTPMGPYFVPARYIPDPHTLKIACRVNGEARQDATTAEMVHPVQKVVSEMSRWMTLEPGDVIATGTPEGVYNLRDGDVCECEIEHLGTLRNLVERPS